MKIISGVYWDKGKREWNQDSVTLQQALMWRGRTALAVVSDGIGGLDEGETASGYIVERLVENFYGQMLALLGRGKGKKALTKSILRCFCNISRELGSYGESKGISLGATVSVLFFWRKHYLLFHLGDSRIYLLHKGRQKQLTRDHSARGGITKCMGSFGFQYPDIYSGRVRRKSGFLLCTDGFYRNMEGRFFRALAPEDIENEEQIARRLRGIGQAVKEKGENDNLSAVYMVMNGRFYGKNFMSQV